MEDAPPKPCCERLLVLERITWCVLDEGHDGTHVAKLPRELPENTFEPKGKR